MPNHAARSNKQLPPSRPRRAIAGFGLILAIIFALAVGAYAIIRMTRSSPPTAFSAIAAQTDQTVAPPETFSKLLTAVTTYETQGDHEAAEGVLRAAVTQFIEDQDLRVAYAELLIGRSRFDEAYEQYVAALAIGPRDAGLEFRAGTLCVQLEKHNRAIEHLNAAQRGDPSNPQHPLMLGNEQMRLGMLDEALASFVRTTVLDPDNALAWGALAKLALRQNHAALALQHARKAAAIEPDEPAWRFYEAKALKRQGDAEGALGVLTRLDAGVQRRPDYARTIAECLGMLGRADEAKAWSELAKAGG